MEQRKYNLELTRQQIELIVAAFNGGQVACFDRGYKALGNDFRKQEKLFDTLAKEIATAEKTGKQLNKEQARMEAVKQYHMEEAEAGII